MIYVIAWVITSSVFSMIWIMNSLFDSEKIIPFEKTSLWIVPIHNNLHGKINWFGAGLLSFIGLVCLPLAWLIYLLHWLSTINIEKEVEKTDEETQSNQDDDDMIPPEILEQIKRGDIHIC